MKDKINTLSVKEQLNQLGVTRAGFYECSGLTYEQFNIHIPKWHTGSLSFYDKKDKRVLGLDCDRADFNGEEDALGYCRKQYPGITITYTGSTTLCRSCATLAKKYDRIIMESLRKKEQNRARKK